MTRNKKTNCSSHFTLKVHNTKKTYACTVALHWEHNHSIHSAHAYSFHPISEDTKMVFTKYFAQGHSPSSAIRLHQLNLVVQHEGNEHDLEMALADRSVTPLPMDVYSLFRKWRYETHGDEGGAKMFDQLEELVKSYNKEHNADGGKAILQPYDCNEIKTWGKSDTNQPLILAICTPLMARAHALVRQSAIG